LNYVKIYFQIIEKAQKENRESYLELHHIIPKCIYGENLLDERLFNKGINHESNLVYLTAREHFVAHWLLHRAFPTNKKLGLAFWAMAGMIGPDHKREYIPSSIAFEEARIAAVNSRKVPILQYSLLGDFLREYDSLNSASEKVGIVPNAIGQNLNNFTKSAGGFQWLFKTENYPKRIDPYIIDNNGLPIAQYNLEGKLIQKFESLLDAERKTNHSEGSIRASMNRGSILKGTSYFFIQFNKNQLIPFEVEPFKFPVHGFSIPVVQLSADGECYINEFPSVTHAAIFLNKNTGHISSACKGIRETAYGYKWQYLNEFDKKIPKCKIEEVKIKQHSKEVAQYDLDGKFIRIFKSASEAARITKDSQSNISSVALGKRNYSGKYQYAYLKNGQIPILKPTIISVNKPKKVLQIDMSSNEIISEFESVGIAAKKINGSQSNISACINGRKKYAYGFKWEIEN
jgi:hypothetical protein